MLQRMNKKKRNIYDMVVDTKVRKLTQSLAK